MALPAIFFNPDGRPHVDAGGVVYADGSYYRLLPAGSSGQVLQSNGSSAPSWVAPSGTSITLETASTTTGTQNNWAPTIASTGTTIQPWNGSADLTVTGLSGLATGAVWVFKNIGSHNAFFPNLSGSSTGTNQFTNCVATGSTPVGPGGHIAYYNDGTNLKLVSHLQGKSVAWTPVIGGSTGTSGQSYSSQAGFYVVSGNEVFVQARVTLSTKGTISGTVQIQGLPFTVANVSGSVGQCGAPISFFASMATSWCFIGGLCVNNTTTASLFGVATAAATGSTALTTSDISNTTDFLFAFKYIAD